MWVVVWLLLWWANDFPTVEPWNDWFIWLVIAAILSLTNGD